MTTGSTPPSISVSFYFDPCCPWTWATSRWLVEVAERQGVQVSWRAFELADGRSPDELPAELRPYAELSRGFLRIVEAAHGGAEAGRIDAFYSAVGRRLHESGQSPARGVLHEAATEAGLSADLRAAASRTELDSSVAAARAEAQSLAGDDVGSPVLAFDGPGTARTGFFGPVLHPAPRGDEADALWQLVRAAAATPAFFELKRRRTSHP